MSIKVGDRLPSVILKHLTADGMQDLYTDTVFENKRVVLFAVPGAFTPTCSAKHLPGYVEAYAQFKNLGIEVACLSVNDPFVMKEWGEKYKATNLTFLPDGNGTFTKSLGLEMDGSAYGLGTRSQRFALFAEDGIVKTLAVEKPGAFEVSSADAMLKAVALSEAA